MHPVFTAHPTEARRRAVSTALRRIAACVEALDAPSGPAGQAEVRRRLREEIDLLWLTAPLRVTPIGPIDEVRTVMAVFDETLFTLTPAIYRALDAACRDQPAQDQPGTGPAPVAPAFLRFGSWVGADRDGNPSVTAQVTREAAVIQADHALRALENATSRIGRALTVHADAAPPTGAFALALEAAETEHPELLAGLAQRSPQEPYRTYLLHLAQRLRATRMRHADLAYTQCGDFLAALRLVQDALAGAGARRQAFGELQNLIWQVATFGFHAFGLEVRQHSGVHARALAEIEAGGEVSAQTTEVLATLRAMGWIQGRFGVDACHRYVVSFTRSGADIAAVYRLAGHATRSGEPPVLDVIPLFESGKDLQNASRVLDEMLELEPVAARMRSSGRALEAMLGYSDSAKELGPVSATLELYDAQERLARWAAEQAYQGWPLLTVLLDNAEMSLAKTDRRIAARHLALGGRDDLTTVVLAEYDLTKRLLLAVTGHDRLLANRPVLSRAVTLRDPYVDALSHLQLRALAALRALPEGRDPEQLRRLLLLSVNGVAAGLQNTG